MPVGLIYLIVIILANTLGAISGMGGGVLIKPVFDFLQYHSVGVVSFYSSVAVFSMSLISTYRQAKKGTALDWSFSIKLSIGAIIGGIVGSQLLGGMLSKFSNERMVNLVQIIVTIVTLLFSYLYSKFKWQAIQLSGNAMTLSIGGLLGFFASLLGIGGGPINVAVIEFVFGIPIKLATIYSIVIISFSQFANIIAMVINGLAFEAKLGLLWYVVPAGLIGGTVGAIVSNQVSEETVRKVYEYVIILVLLINMYNAWKILF